MHSNYSKSQLVVILAFYYFEKTKTTDKLIKEFTTKFNKIYKQDLSMQNIVYALSLFKSVDPSYNITNITPKNEMFIYLWNYYITEERIADLKKEYNNFKNGLIAQNEILVNYDEYKKEIVDKISQLELCFYGDFPRPIYEANKMDYKQNKRDLITSYNALKLANFKCEYSNQHKSFMRKNIDLTYTEGHHLIPLKYQYMFNVNLDVEANIVSLCSECHNILHYGRDYEILLRKLYDARIDRLNTCGIKISIDELLEMYK